MQEVTYHTENVFESTSINISRKQSCTLVHLSNAILKRKKNAPLSTFFFDWICPVLHVILQFSTTKLFIICSMFFLTTIYDWIKRFNKDFFDFFPDNTKFIIFSQTRSRRLFTSIFFRSLSAKCTHSHARRAILLESAAVWAHTSRNVYIFGSAGATKLSRK